MIHEIIPAMNPETAIDRNNPEMAKTAIELEWPDTFSDRAKMVISYFAGTIALFQYAGKFIVTDESLELTEYGDGSTEAPWGGPRWEADTLNGVENWLESVADNYDEEEEEYPRWVETKRYHEKVVKYKAAMALFDNLVEQGAKIRVNGQFRDITASIYGMGVTACKSCGCNAVIYELVYPHSIEHVFFVIFADGTVDCGTKAQVLTAVEEHK